MIPRFEMLRKLEFSNYTGTTESEFEITATIFERYVVMIYFLILAYNS